MAPNPEPKWKKTPTAEKRAPSNADVASHPIVASPENGPGSDEERQKDSLRREQVGEARAEEKHSPMEETLELREMDATPAVTPPPSDAAPEAEERVNVAEYHAPTTEGYVTQTGVLSATGSATRPRTSPKRKQLKTFFTGGERDSCWTGEHGETTLRVRVRVYPRFPVAWTYALQPAIPHP